MKKLEINKDNYKGYVKLFEFNKFDSYHKKKNISKKYILNIATFFGVAFAVSIIMLPLYKLGILIL